MREACRKGHAGKTCTLLEEGQLATKEVNSLKLLTCKERRWESFAWPSGERVGRQRYME